MNQFSTLYIGLEVHNESIAVADSAKDHDADVIDLGTIGTRHVDLDHLVRTRQSKAQHLIFGYEAGPGGYWLYRYLRKKGYVCGVVAPSLLPQKAGDRVNTDRRDAVQWARLMRSGDLTPVDVPTVDDDASRDRCRAREEAGADLKTAKFRLQAVLLRHDIRSTGQATGGPAHRRWLSEVVCPPPAQPIVFQEDVRAVTEHTARLQRLEQERQEHVKWWRLHPVVEALQAWRGGQCTVAVTAVAELGDVTRVETPRQLMKDLGLIPAAESTGERRRQGAMTEAGNTHARRALLEGAWASRDPATGSRHVQLRLETPPQVIQDLSWTAQGRLGQRDRRLSARGNHAHQVVVAIARALVGCRWAMAQQVPVTP